MLQRAKYEADLHSHSSASDGLLSPSELVCRAADIGLKALAITDHDTIDGWREAKKAAAASGLIFLNGIEINTDFNGQEVHILGYGMREDNISFENQLRDLQDRRKVRVMEILDGLSRQGIIINMDQVKEHVKGRSIGRPHIAQALVRLGYAGSSREAFDNYLAVGRPAYVPRYKLGPAKAIGMIRGAGGVAVLAHPGKLKLEGNLDEWIRQGLQGIETNHPEHDSGDVRRLQMLAEDYNLIATGGSDFHGRKIKPDIRLGQWGVGLEAVGQIKDMSRAN